MAQYLVRRADLPHRKRTKQNSTDMDRMTTEQRSRLMSRIRSKDTAPELTVRSVAHRLGYRFRLHGKDLPGKPDLVFRSRMKVIFVHGCFWHGHTCRKGRLPETRADFWLTKIQTNKARDRRVRRKLNSLGWSCLTIWECQIKHPDLLESKLKCFFG
ncbi:MAG: very short patch repair endonuclease [Pseudomonadota bacterium]